MAVCNLGYEQGTRQLRVGIGKEEFKKEGMLKSRRIKRRDGEEGCETGATKCLQISHLLQEEPKSF